MRSFGTNELEVIKKMLVSGGPASLLLLLSVLQHRDAPDKSKIVSFFNNLSYFFIDSSMLPKLVLFES